MQIQDQIELIKFAVPASGASQARVLPLRETPMPQVTQLLDLGRLTDAVHVDSERRPKSSQKAHGPAENSGEQRGTPGSPTGR